MASCAAQALDELQRARGGPLFARRETGLIAKALLRPGGLDRLLADPRRRTLVGTVDDAVVGMAMGRLDEVGETRLGIIDACYVEARRPRCRVSAGRCSSELVAWFTASGCRGVDINALPGDRATEEPPRGVGVQGAAHHHAPHLGMTAPARPARRAPPVVAVGGVAVRDGALLLVQRATDPQAGRWTIPGGHVEPGETLAARRRARGARGDRAGGALRGAARMGRAHGPGLPLRHPRLHRDASPDDGPIRWRAAMPPLWRGSRSRRCRAWRWWTGSEEFLRAHGVID